jgi:hypothetical protein
MQFNLPAGITPGSPAFRSAQAACKPLVPALAGAGGVSAGEQGAALKFAQCMRAHGVPSYPDPTYRNGRPIDEPLTAYGINLEAPAVHGAEKACGGD